MHELHHHGRVEPQLFTQEIHLILGRILPENKKHRVSHILKEHNGDQRHHEQDEEALQDPLNNKRDHGISGRAAGE